MAAAAAMAADRATLRAEGKASTVGRSLPGSRSSNAQTLQRRTRELATGALVFLARAFARRERTSRTVDRPPRAEQAGQQSAVVNPAGSSLASRSRARCRAASEGAPAWANARGRPTASASADAEMVRGAEGAGVPIATERGARPWPFERGPSRGAEE